MRRDELRRRLEQAGASPAPEPATTFTERLEQRLRLAFGYREARLRAEAELRERRPITVPDPRQRPWIRSPAPMGAAALLLIAITAGALLRADRLPSTQPLQLMAVDGPVTVQLPEGSSVAAQPGMRVPDGAVLVTGPSARVITSAGELGPREIGVVEGRRMRRVEHAPRRPAAEEPPPSARPEPSRSPEIRPAREDPMRVPLRPLPPIGQERQPDQRDTREVPAQTSPSPRPSPDGEPAPSTAPTADGTRNEPVAFGHAEPTPEHAIGLKTQFISGGVALRWTPYDDRRVAFYVVLRAPGPQRPTWPPSGDTQVIGKSGAGEDTSFVDLEPTEEPPVYRIVAVDEQGNELARSRPVTPAPEGRSRG